MKLDVGEAFRLGGGFVDLDGGSDDGAGSGEDVDEVFFGDGVVEVGDVD